MSANENPFGTSDKVQTAIKNWDFTQSRDYPDGNANRLRSAVAAELGVTESQLCIW